MLLPDAGMNPSWTLVAMIPDTTRPAACPFADAAEEMASTQSPMVQPPMAPLPMVVEKRDACGRLLARVGVAGGVLEGPCLFYGEDGETVVARADFSAGRPVPPQAVPPQAGLTVVVPSLLSGAPVASGDSLF